MKVALLIIQKFIISNKRSPTQNLNLNSRLNRNQKVTQNHPQYLTGINFINQISTSWTRHPQFKSFILNHKIMKHLPKHSFIINHPEPSNSNNINFINHIQQWRSQRNNFTLFLNSNWKLFMKKLSFNLCYCLFSQDMIATAFIFKFMLTETARGSHSIKSFRIKYFNDILWIKFKVGIFQIFLLCKTEKWGNFLGQNLMHFVMRAENKTSCT